MIVKQNIIGMSYQAGLVDNFALPVDPALTNSCLVAAVSGFPFWKHFDQVAVNRLFGHRFSGLPLNIVQAQLIIRMKPENDGTGVGVGSDNDGLFIGLTNCAPSSWAYGVSIKTLPGAGGNWFPGHLPTTFTNNLSAAVIAHMNATQRLDVMVHDDTTVDYMILRLWICPPVINPNGGLPHWTKNGTNGPSTIAVMPQPELPEFGPIGTGAAMAVSPPSGDPASSVEIGLGGGQAFSFTTVLDMNAPEGSEIVVSAPTEDGTNAPLFSLVKGKCPPKCNWDIKPAKKFWDDGGSVCRVSAVSTNGDLLDSYVVSQAEAQTESLLSLSPEPGIDQFPVSFLVDATTGEITVTFPGSTARRLCGGLPCPRGWDGTIKGRITEDARRKGWDGTVKCPCYDDNSSRIVFTPLGGGGSGGQLLSSLEISSTGLSELALISERLYVMGREVMPALEGGLVTFQGTSTGDGVSLTALEDNSGVSLDLGRASSFDLGIGYFEKGDKPTQEQYFRVKGPRFAPGTTTNRPPPPVFDARLTQSLLGVDCTVDYSGLGATGLNVRLYSNGVWVAYGYVPGPSLTPDNPLILDRWPQRLGLMETNVLRLTSAEPFNLGGLLGDELRFIPELPADAPSFDYASELQYLTTEGMESLLNGLERVVNCPPTPLNIASTASGTVIFWSGEGYRLLGAEHLDGPWIDLSVSSPLLLAPHAPQRYFRLVCE